MDLFIGCWTVWKDGFLTLRPDVYSMQLSDCGTPFGSHSPVLRSGGNSIGSPRRRRHHRATSECRYCVMHHSSVAVTPGGAAAAVLESPIVALVPNGFPLLHFKFVGSEYSHYCCIAVWILRRPLAPTRQGGATPGCNVSRLPASIYG